METSPDRVTAPAGPSANTWRGRSLAVSASPRSVTVDGGYCLRRRGWDGTGKVFARRDPKLNRDHSRPYNPLRLALIPGTRLGVYEVTAQIGEGGMGQVYRATDTKLKRQVAIKILPPSVDGRSRPARALSTRSGSAHSR